MRILIATTHPTVVGGVETYLRHLLPALVSRGHEVALLHEAAAGPGRAAVSAGVPGMAQWHLADAAALREAAAWRPDVCYTQGLAEPTFEAALIDRFPVVLFAHDYHGTCVSGTKRRAFPLPRPCGRTLGPGCLLAYLPCRCGGLSPTTMPRLYAVQRRRQSLLPRYRAVLVASRHMREEYRRHGVPDDRLHLAPLFPPGQAPDPAPPADRAPGGRVLLMGRLTDLKGGRFLVKALRLAAATLRRPLTLVVAGDGPERPSLEELARRQEVPVEFVGWVGSARRAELMRAADVLAVPSVWPEPFGLVGIEAGCVGLPAVAYAVGGIPDWLVPGRSGELSPGGPPTVLGLAQALHRALADPAHLARLRAGAWEMAQHYSQQRHVAALEPVLEQAAAPALPPPVAAAREADGPTGCWEGWDG
jgi:glycosyltransferase involved in cell wall biosynthesis